MNRLVSGNSYFTTETELLTIYKAEPIRAVQTPESHFFFLHWTALDHLSSMRTTAFVLLSALMLATILNVDCVKHHEQIDCSKYKMLPSEERFCYEIYAPICGSDGKTYDNDCYFCYEVEKTNNKLKFVHFGKC
ncbi:serine protease inhibitor Kazal-type 9 isoform X1 [Bos taurus]|nr:serine protease inhibitor Kazal-type 9 isoform X1 [Bos taurus]XP_059744768.1 serine protease inhibitor Kazal-type 9 isoform X1 [Bos taurus]XP_059744769.1 serine protease inhibitor Kazal-type 9 isoform X1 [Bos taurus]